MLGCDIVAIGVGLSLTFIMLLFTWIKFKDVASPPFILSGVWFIMYIILMLNYNEIDNLNFYYSSFAVGLTFFVLGFSLVTYNKKTKIKCAFEKKISEFSYNYLTIKVILIFEIIVAVIYMYSIKGILSTNFVDNIWNTLVYAKSSGDFNESILIKYSRNFTIAVSIFTSMIYFSNSNKRNRRYFILTTIIALAFSITAGNRSVIFMIIISITIANIYINNYSNKIIALVLTTIAIIVLGIFIRMAFVKYTYLKDMPTLEFISLQFRVYFSTSLIAFVQWISMSPLHENGSNTFRFIFAIMNAVGYNVNVVDTVQEFTRVGENNTNVYTVLYYYAKDFGIAFSFLMQFIFGVIYGKLYANAVLMKSKNLFSIAMISVLYFPLIGQFFDDMYLSRLSSWIQYIFWFWLFCKTSFLVKEKKTNNM